MLTASEITKAIKNCQAETWLTDTSEGRGAGSLKLRLRPDAGGDVGAVWVVAWKRGTEQCRMQLGRYPALAIAAARDKYRQDVAPMLLLGKDPRVQVAANGKPTVGRMFQAYVDDMKARGKASWPELERALLTAKENAADALGRERMAGTIDPADIAAYLAPFFRRGSRGAADHHRAYVSAAFGWAMRATHDYTATSREDWGVKSNPATAVKRDAGARQNRDRNLSADELATLWRAADHRNNHWGEEIAACVRLLILCGQRVQETLRIDGREIDLEAGVWNMPAEKTKGRKRPHSLPLGPLAVATLRPMVELHGDGPLFPARTGARGTYIDHRSVKQAIDRWNVGVMPVFQTRDLRRTWKSRTGELGISKDIRDTIQQHTRRDIGSKHYDRADYLPQMREAMAKWEEWLDTVLAEPAPDALAA